MANQENTFREKGNSPPDDPSRGSEDTPRTPNAPSLQLPKGGGAIRGIGEKFSVNAITGTGSLTIPIFTSPGRTGFSPQLSLSYDSGSGNGPFGIGWQLKLPAITRKTDKGLPRYDDAGASDVFLLSDAEDLVPLLTNQGNQWNAIPYNDPGGNTYTIHRFRPRIEGLFARIERWQRLSDGDTHWRATTKDNVVNIYGQSAAARIANPADPSQVFKWLLETSFDDKGNVISYRFRFEDKAGIDAGAANEQNRFNGNAPFTNTYLKRILYGNQTPYVAGEDLSIRGDWLFEAVMDYGEHNVAVPLPAPDAALQWVTRADPFSGFRSTFEIRTYRLCQRVLLFHHFPAPGNGAQGYDALVRSTNFTYDQEDTHSPLMGNRIATRLLAVTQTGYTWDAANNAYITGSMPPVEFNYSEAVLDPTIRTVDPGSLENVPAGLAGKGYQWLDLDGEGSAGILFEDGGGLYYKRNSSPANTTVAAGIERASPDFQVQELISSEPSLGMTGGETQFMDLAGDGHQDMARLKGPVRGFYRRDEEDWADFQTFSIFPVIDTRDPNVRFIDVDGDGLADILVSEDEVFSWHRSLGEYGFGDRQYARKPFDEERGPALIFADPTQSIFLADMTGDGLTDIVRIRSGEVCYWPNRGYGRFGARVTMDNTPCFDTPDAFDQRRIRLADIDGSGNVDILYFRNDGVAVYFNQAGNAWSDEQVLTAVPAIDNLASINVMDLLGNGLACLVWSSPLPSDAGFPMHYIDLMGGQKPHLLIAIKNNLGSEIKVQYACSTKFYVQDRNAGTPWVTRLAFPVYVVQRMEAFDYIGRSKLVTTYRYRHGYFDGVEREFRGFGFVEQRDAESFGDDGSLFTGGTDPEADTLHAPPVVTRTWFHTGAWPDGETILHHMAQEYFTAAGSPIANLLPDTILPTDIYLSSASRISWSLTGDEAREAVRALKGSILRQEVYADDGSAKSTLPYTVSERNYTVECFQPRGGNRYAVFFTHARETIDYHCERNPADPRITHTVLLDADPYGNTLTSINAAYARNIAATGLNLAPTLAPNAQPDLSVDPSTEIPPEQVQPLFTMVQNRYTPVIDDFGKGAMAYRTPLLAEACTYQMTRSARPDESVVYSFADLQGLAATAETIAFETAPDPGKTQRRLIDLSRTLYLKDDLTPLPLLQNDALGLVYESYQLAYTPGLAQQLFVTGNTNPNKPADTAALNTILSGEGGYVDAFGDGNWWIPSGRTIYSPVGPTPPDPFVQDTTYAAKHFYQPQAVRDPFGQYTRLAYDPFDLLLVQTQDALGNTSSAVNDYRVLQPAILTDPNGNQTMVAFDALQMVCGTADCGKVAAGVTESGDSLVNFKADLAQADIDNFFHAANPATPAPGLLGLATSRNVYDLYSFVNSVVASPNDATKWIPVFEATISRELHVNDIPTGGETSVQLRFSYSDGFGREIQKKIQAEPGPLDLSNPAAPVADPRWVGSGWVILNNKSKPIRQYEAFFSPTHQFEFANKTGVTPTLFYDPLERVVATVRPDHSWEKTVFAPWWQKTWDGNDTVVLDPKNDPDVGQLISRLPDADYLPTWYGLRTDAAAAAAAWPDPAVLQQQQDAAAKAFEHNDTPTQAYFDALSRTFLTVAHNRAAQQPDEYYATRSKLDIQGNQVSVTDALGRLVMQYDYNLPRTLVHHASMDAGERWVLSDVAKKPILIWDSRGFLRTNTYDELRRLMGSMVTGGGLNGILAEKIIYGDSRVGGPASPEQANLRTRVYQYFDAAGVVVHQGANPVTAKSEGYDFKGNPIRSSRQLIQGSAYRATVDWNQAQTLGELYTGASRYDALNRVIQETAPYSNQPGATLQIQQLTYNEANLLQSLDVWLQSAAEPSGLLDVKTASLHPVTSITYNARGQRIGITYGTGNAVLVSTAYQYDPDTFRLVELATTRSSDGVSLQLLQYYYDPTGNITHIRDTADIQNVVYFRNKRVEPSADYTYDALYRLIKASGREQLGQTGGVPNAPSPQSYNDWSRINLPHPGDGNAMGIYTENFSYDAVGNFQNIRHLGSDPVSPGWSRTYSYQETSGLEPARQNNRLTTTTVGGTIETYSTGGTGYDAHGNMLSLPQLEMMQWDFKDQLQMTQRQRVSDSDEDGILHQGERTYYVYDASGQRVLKATESSTGRLIKQRVYLGLSEMYREYDNTGAIALQRESLQVMDDRQRVALVELRTRGDDGTPARLVRYQLTNQLNSACLELDDTGTVISYEEYYPYGSTSYQAMNQTIKAAAKRYRYTGMERDEETGLGYHVTRYYASWLGRWTSPDPLGLADGPCPYTYSRDNPVGRSDQQGMLSQENQAFLKEATTHLDAEVKKLDTRIQKITNDVDARMATDQSFNESKFGKEYEKHTELHSKITKAAFIKQKIDEVRTAELKARKVPEITTLKNKLAGLLQFYKTHAFTDDSLRVASVVTNEAGIDPDQSKLAVAYGWMNRTSGNAREAVPGASEISHYTLLKDKLSSLSTNDDKNTFLEELKDSVKQSEIRLNDQNPTANDPTQGADHWISPDAPDFDKKSRTHPLERTINGKKRFVPNWARATNDPEVPKLQTGPHAILNKPFKEVTGIPDFRFYVGVK